MMHGEGLKGVSGRFYLLFTSEIQVGSTVEGGCKLEHLKC